MLFCCQIVVEAEVEAISWAEEEETLEVTTLAEVR